MKKKDSPSLKRIDLNLKYITEEEKAAIKRVKKECPDKKIYLKYENLITEEEYQAMYQDYLEGLPEF